MPADRVCRRICRVAATTLTMIAVMASPALAAKLQISLRPSKIADGYHIRLVVKGRWKGQETGGQGAELVVDVQESKAACARTAADENTLVGSGAFPFADNEYDMGLALGSFTESEYFIPDGPGPYRFCGYVSGPTRSGTSYRTIAKATAILRISAKAAPAPPKLPGQV